MMMRGFYFVVLSLLKMSLLFLGEANHTSRNYVVYMGALTSSVEGDPKADHAQLVKELMISNKNSIVYTYNKSFFGIVARLTKEDAASIAKRPEVVSVFTDSSTVQLHTTRSWDFLKNLMDNIDHSSGQYYSSNNVVSSDSNSSNGGYETIIGIMDTGISPRHPSFNDSLMGPIPKHWKGECEEALAGFSCNKKIIGARIYDNPEHPGSITSAIDVDGHGTHVASVAAGMSVKGASYKGLAKGVARGGSPGSRIAVYSVFGTYPDCQDSSILKAFDDAIADGVDIMSISIGGDFNSIFASPFAIGAFHAMEKGIVVVASVGNDGLDPETVGNYSPWILSVGSTTIDRDFEMDIVLGGRRRKDVVIKGGGINFSSLNKSAVYPLVDGNNCNYSNGVKVNGSIVLCNNDDSAIFYKISDMIDQGMIGIIIIDDGLRQLTFDINTTIALTAVSRADGTLIQSYINSTKQPLATILPTKTVLHYKPAPVVTAFSSRMPPKGIKNLIKPDVSAPGVEILVAELFNGTISEAYSPLFTFASGTSIACPHVSSLAAIVKSQHPTWSPSAIKSAIMTTAIPTNNHNHPITNATGSRATPYEVGSGEINLFGPLSPGLVYETELIDYILFLCNLGYNTSKIKRVLSTVPNNFSCPINSSSDSISDLNYPSIAVSGFKMRNLKKTVTRRVTNVGKVRSTYRVDVKAPAGVHVDVVPNKLKFTKDVTKLSFQVTFKLKKSLLRQQDLVGSITWLSKSNHYNVRSPFVVSSA